MKTLGCLVVIVVVWLILSRTKLGIESRKSQELMTSGSTNVPLASAA